MNCKIALTSGIILAFGALNLSADVRIYFPFITEQGFEHQQKSKISPVPEFGKRMFPADDFRGFSSSSESENLFYQMGNSDPIAVRSIDGNVEFTDLSFDRQDFIFILAEGNLEVVNRGEFGGEMKYVPNTGSTKSRSIFNGNVNFVFEYEGGTYFLTGLSHLYLEVDPALYKLVREEIGFGYRKILDLDGVPEAMAIYKDKILIAGNRSFTVIKRDKTSLVFHKQFVLGELPWRGLYPNSIAVKSENEFFVGHRGGYTIIKLPCSEIEYFRYDRVS